MKDRCSIHILQNVTIRKCQPDLALVPRGVVLLSESPCPTTVDTTGPQAGVAFFCGSPLIQVDIATETEGSSTTKTHGEAGGSLLAGGCCRSRSKVDVNIVLSILTHSTVCLVPNRDPEDVTMRLCMES